MEFPQAIENQIYVKISALDAGELTLQEKFFVTNPTPNAKATVPSLSFLIQHGDTKMIFDGGLRHSPEDYKPAIAQRIRGSLLPYLVKTDAAEFLKRNGCDPSSVDMVMLSHVHYDHIGDPGSFPNAKYIVGAGSIKTMKEGSPGFEISLFESDLFNERTVIELPPSPATNEAMVDWSLSSRDPNHVWKPLGHFPAALDFFGDGSVWVVDAPGHMEGHINLLARIAPGKWVYLGGDSCHDPRILSGEKDIAVYLDVHGHTKCAHNQKEVAEHTVANIRMLLQRVNSEEFEVVLAHDQCWYANNRHRFYPSAL